MKKLVSTVSVCILAATIILECVCNINMGNIYIRNVQAQENTSRSSEIAEEVVEKNVEIINLMNTEEIEDNNEGENSDELSETESIDTVNSEEKVLNEIDTEKNVAAIEVTAPSVILMEASTGSVIYEKNSTQQLPPASVTKIMTLICIFDALEQGKIKLEDEVSVSEYAASMGGSQVFLEPGEIQDVNTLIKCISVASANDACVTLGEYICGSEEEFVNQMNKRAKELGMNDTTFKNCNGLDTDGHITTAKDIALMSRELITKYPQIFDYCKIWMENIVHETKKGSSEFGLTNTNKLIRQYQYATGLKTGSTSKAKFCVSATARKNDIDLIAVIMAAPDSKTRFADAVKLLNYGFSKCQLYVDDSTKNVVTIDVKKSVVKETNIVCQNEFRYLDTKGMVFENIEKEVKIPEYIEAPLKAGDVVGNVSYKYEGQEIGSINIVATEDIERAGMKDYFFQLFRKLVEL